MTRYEVQKQPKTKWKPRILRVDDSLINLKILEAYLKKLGHNNLMRSIDGKEAHRKVVSAKMPFDLIFMDLAMPICDGFESTELIRKHEKQQSLRTNPAYIVALTSQASEEDQKKAFKSGVDHFVTKPMSLVQLKARLAICEGKYRHEAAEKNVAVSGFVQHYN
ncbi:CheY-like superfamily [Calycina marina]|uniref:CheY-like superfamily n=1 Tax=Calycina marina TaxID=1763456 RepID=A0A9P7YZ59_9HELO|nr:CheY-like superfamily [Calycina marina]